MATEEIRMDDKITVKSIAPWDTGARRLASIGDIHIIPYGTVLLTREEVIAQAQNGNKLLTGTDGEGSHATWYIDDEWTRKEVGFDKQVRLTKEEISRICGLKTQSTFESNIKKVAVTRAEKAMLMDCLEKLKINDYSKIRFCEKYTRIKFNGK